MKIEKIINYDKDNKEGILPIWAEALYKRQGKDNKNNFLEILEKLMDVHNEGRSLKEKIKDKKLLLEFEETWDYVDDKLADILLTLQKLENIVAKTNIELVDKKRYIPERVKKMLNEEV